MKWYEVHVKGLPFAFPPFHSIIAFGIRTKILRCSNELERGENTFNLTSNTVIQKPRPKNHMISSLKNVTPCQLNVICLEEARHY